VAATCRSSALLPIGLGSNLASRHLTFVCDPLLRTPVSRTCSVCLWALPLPSSKKEARPEKRGVSTDKATDGQTARMFSPSEWTEGGGAEGVRLPAFSLSPIPPDPNRTFEGEETGILI
jgi:hypothetical protein